MSPEQSKKAEITTPLGSSQLDPFVKEVSNQVPDDKPVSFEVYVDTHALRIDQSTGGDIKIETGSN